MEEWVVPCNLKYYDVKGAFRKLQCLDWKQSMKAINIGDIVYIYVGKPVMAVKYKCKVNKINLDHIEIDDSEFVVNGDPYETYGNHMELQLLEEYDDEKFSLSVLKSNGLKGNIQGPRRVQNLLG